MIGIQSAQLAAEVEQKVHLLQTFAGLIEKRDVLQNDRGLPRDLVIHLPVFISERSHRLRADRQHCGYGSFVNFDRQADERFRAQSRQERCFAPVEVLIQVRNQDRFAGLQTYPKRIPLPKQRLRAGSARHIPKHSYQPWSFAPEFGDHRH